MEGEVIWKGAPFRKLKVTNKLCNSSNLMGGWCNFQVEKVVEKIAMIIGMRNLIGKGT